MNYKIPLLPLDKDIESKTVLKKCAKAHQALAELKGIVPTIPNESILINTLSLQEAKDSSAIENIVTTHDELFKSDNLAQQFITLAAKEVFNYSTALQDGFKHVKNNDLLTSNYIKKIQAIIEQNNAGFRTQSGTTLKNEQTGEVIYTPPQTHDEIIELMSNLEKFINNDASCDWDDLVKMAVIHHQFESIHPFYDGNGRTGRVINVLYLIKQDLLSLPVLYLSRYINQHKQNYYRLLQTVRTDNEWEDWLLFMLTAVEQTSKQTVALIKEIKELMQRYKLQFSTELPKTYNQDLLNNIFSHPYTKIEFVITDLQVTRKTAAKYLDEMVGIGLLSKHKIGKDNYYLNDALYQSLLNVSAK
ncbi:addiction module protein [Methylococcaceae bacterium CS1]|nr:addiction module protein [Methylococcaceae bacterium CS4]TXL02703.1 addiction module protein [Methylococcaceae bacterium CS3]TXL02931.1 addiction module protein [Methylococcaceae bacterium CS1]TXL04642.1 addiction module protein [Methylococcaceae bacterium CS2]